MISTVQIIIYLSLYLHEVELSIHKDVASLIHKFEYRKQNLNGFGKSNGRSVGDQHLQKMINRFNARRQNKTPRPRPQMATNRWVSISRKDGFQRTTPTPVSLQNYCDYGAYYCLKGHKTGNVCGQTLYNQYYDFDNYCMLQYVNCMEGQDLWHIAHMGECLKVEVVKEYPHYDYNDDFFLDNVYTMYT